MSTDLQILIGLVVSSPNALDTDDIEKVSGRTKENSIVSGDEVEGCASQLSALLVYTEDQSPCWCKTTDVKAVGSKTKLAPQPNGSSAALQIPSPQFDPCMLSCDYWAATSSLSLADSTDVHLSREQAPCSLT
ncbi:hypothetical protein VNO77_03418 [Canavalia gladiata]|uniref:Uncharacterized protein n=1 Tax=Canavalia gladiata TaxID=3824 RepID=A0AAN9MUV2_CANGL